MSSISDALSREKRSLNCQFREEVTRAENEKKAAHACRFSMMAARFWNLLSSSSSRIDSSEEDSSAIAPERQSSTMSSLHNGSKQEQRSSASEHRSSANNWDRLRRKKGNECIRVDLIHPILSQLQPRKSIRLDHHEICWTRLSRSLGHWGGRARFGGLFRVGKGWERVRKRWSWRVFGDVVVDGRELGVGCLAAECDGRNRPRWRA
jgi:hypothetical protein